MSWVATAVAGASAIYGAVDANQKKQRNKGYINDAYQNSKQRLDLRQQAGRQGAAEAAGARGLTAGGDVNASPIAAAMVGGKMTAQGETPHTLGAQQASDNAVQMGLESQDLEQQRGRAETENKAQYTNSLINSAFQGVQAGANVYGAKQDLAAMKTPAGAVGSPAPLPSAPANGVGTIRGAYGIDPITAVPHAGPPLSPGGATRLGTGQQNFSFGRGT